MPSDSSDTSHTTLLKHLDRVYEMARVLAPTEKRASKLVEATYRRAAQSSAPGADMRAWLLRLLLQTYATRRSDAATTSSVSTMRRPADLLQDFRQQTAEAALQRVVPVAFALRSPREQLVLTLCDIVALESDEAAVVLDTDPQMLHDETTAARNALWKGVRRELTAGEQRLVNEELPDGALQDALRSVVAPHLGPLPPTLRPAVAAIVAQKPSVDPDIPEGFSGAPSPTDAPEALSSSPSSSSSTPVSSSDSGTTWYKQIQHISVALLIIVATGLVGYGVSSYLTPSSSSPSTDLIQLSAQQANTVHPSLETTEVDEAEQFVNEQLGRNLAVPRIDSAVFRGVSIVEMENNVRVPAFVFVDVPSEQRITTYAYTYAILDQLGNRAQLAREAREALHEEQRIDLHTPSNSDESVLVWRVRDDIYVTVTKTDPRQLRARIVPAS